MMGRGVWQAPWLGMRDEVILVAIDRNGRLVQWRWLTAEDSYTGAAEALWGELDEADPPIELKLVGS